MSHVVIYDDALKRVLTSRRGPVGNILMQKASVILGHARTNIQTRLVSRTGDLEAALRRVPIEDSSGFHVAVGTDAHHRGFPYARALETGINPQTGEPMAFQEDKSFMVPAVIAAGFRPRGTA